MAKINLPAKKAKYKCKHSSDGDDTVEVYCGRTRIVQLWYSPYIAGWGVSDMESTHDSDSSRVLNKEDMLYIIDCIDQLNSQPMEE